MDQKNIELETWLQLVEPPVFPRIVICGSIENNQTYVFLNRKKYSYDNPILAVEAAFKCLLALEKIPSLCDYVWTFIHKFIYGLDVTKSFSAVNKLIVDIRALGG